MDVLTYLVPYWLRDPQLPALFSSLTAGLTFFLNLFARVTLVCPSHYTQNWGILCLQRLLCLAEALVKCQYLGWHEAACKVASNQTHLDRRGGVLPPFPPSQVILSLVM